MGRPRKQKPSESPSEFSDALNRDKVLTKDSKDTKTSQPRSNKVAPGISSDVKPPVKYPTENKKSKTSSNTTNKKIVAAPKRGSITEAQEQNNSAVNVPMESNNNALKNIQADLIVSSKPEGNGDKVKVPEEDADGLYDVLVQTRRCEELCSGLGLTMNDIRKMKRKYDDNDMFNSGEINQAEFFFMINEERRPLTIGILRLADVSEEQKFLSFDQFLLCVVNFAVFTKLELYQFVFDLYDDDQSGALDEREFTKLSLELQTKDFHFPANVTMATKMLGGKEGRSAFVPDDGLVDLGAFMRFAKSFPVAFYPIMNMQKNVRSTTLGESRWSRITANKLKVQQVFSYMRQHQGAVPQLSLCESIANVFSAEIFNIRKRAGELYALELHRRSSREF